mmetsp:Transcript_3607/g.9945  ORF Transcript_3607/g.9945 Transcript_3607/m.9945 type:complete len:201 (+) Transcript_3607:3724-4326(+)
MRPIFVVPLILAHNVAPYSLAVMVHAANHVCPAFKLSPPVFNSTQRNNHQVWAREFLSTINVLNVTNNLNRFPKAHFVGKNSALLLIPSTGKPIHAVNLIVTKTIVVLVRVRLVRVVQLLPELKPRFFRFLPPCTTRLVCTSSYFRSCRRVSPLIAPNLVTEFFIVFATQHLFELVQTQLQCGRRSFNVCPHMNCLSGSY